MDLSFATDSSCQLDILWHDRDALGMNCAEVSVFEDTDQVCFTGFLESHDGRRLESKIGLEVLSNFTNQSLEWKFSEKEFS